MVNGCIRTNGFSNKTKLKNLLGKMYTPYDSLKNSCSKEECMLPLGSEGSIRYNIVKDNLYTVISIYGNLRDYYNGREIESWFRKIYTQLDDLDDIQQGILEVESVFSK